MTRITYWTTACLEPEIEAVSKEVFDLAKHFKQSRVFAISPHLSATVRRGGRVIGFNPAVGPLLRPCIALLEWRTDINHVYAEISPWIFARTLRRRPTVLTIASEKGTVVPEFLDLCEIVVVQTERMRRRLSDLGFGSDKVRLVYPGIDLSDFSASPRHLIGARTRVLLATFPRADDELESRGIVFLIEMAAAHPEIEFSIVSRPWSGGSTALDALKKLLQLQQLPNVKVLEGVQRDMKRLYDGTDFTIVPYTTSEGGKECPRSLVESLACGVPVLISSVAPFASFVEQHRCGLAFSLDRQGFANAVLEAKRDYGKLSENAASCALVNFDRRETIRAYTAIYESLAILSSGTTGR
jgi:glycosyltransferase involved in cell wall biosynthesis